MQSIRRFTDVDTLYREAAAGFFAAMEAAIDRRGRAFAAIAGGRTPDGWFDVLAAAGWPHWDRVVLGWVDERRVPPGDERSNFGRARQRLLERVPLPPENRRRIEAEQPDAAERYTAMLRRDEALWPAGAAMPVFDYLLLGMGDDGHIASLFPFSPALEATDAVVAVPPPEREPRVGRITLSLPALNAARRADLLIRGSAKAEAFDRRRSAPPGRDMPVTLLATPVLNILIAE